MKFSMRILKRAALPMTPNTGPQPSALRWNKHHRFTKLAGICVLAATQASYGQTPGSFGVVNIVPTGLSGSANDYFAEPSICVGTGANAGKVLVHTFANNVQSQFFGSQNSGIQWSVSGSVLDNDATVDWSPGGSAYVAWLPLTDTSMFVSGSSDPSTCCFDPIPFPTWGVIGTDPNRSPDQPHVQAVNVNGVDHIYVGYNDGRQSPGRTASVFFSLDGGQHWNNTVVEQLTPGGGKDHPTVRVAVSPDGTTVYAAFTRFDSPDPGFLNSRQADVVVVRDDNSGLDGFADLPLDILNATHETIVAHLVVPGVPSYLGAERLGGCSLAINPSHPNEVYVAVTSLCSPSCCTPYWCLSLFESTNSGQTFQDTPFQASLPAGPVGLPELAVTSDGTVGMLYLTFDGSTYEVRFFKGHYYGGPYNGSSTVDEVLAKFPVNTPQSCCGDPYLGDYFGLKAVGSSFYGVFSASGDPQRSHFPFGVYYQRYVKYQNRDGVTLKHDFQLETDGGVLDDGNMNTVQFGIDPFFFYDIGPAFMAMIAYGTSRTLGTGTQIELTWAALPANYPQFKLESSPTLGSGAIWSPVTLVIQTNGVFHAAVVPSQARQFFRLKQDLTGSQFNIFTGDDGNGTLAPGGIVAVAGGHNQTFTATPGSNYAVGLWYLDGVPSQRGVATLTLTNVAQDHTLLATFTASNDLAVTLMSLPRDPTLPVLTNELDYTVRIANTGLNPLTGITLTNLFDPTVIFLSSTSSQGSFSYSAGTLTGILGALGTGEVAMVTMAVVPTVPGAVTDSLNAACDQFEPNLANNSAIDMLNVLMPLAITSQPQSQSVPLDGTALFTVGVSGTPPFGYQWYFDGSFLAGQTNATLTLNNVTNGIAGSYSVSVVQLAARPESRSALASDPATLTVH